jgi:hypothetical protein
MNHTSHSSSKPVHTTKSSTISGTTTSPTPSPIAQGNHEPKMPAGFGKISAADLSAVKLLCANSACQNKANQTSSQNQFATHLWQTVLAKSTPYKQNPKLAAQKAAIYVRKSFIAKYIQLRLFGFPAKLVMPTDNGLFEGDVMLPEIATSAIIQQALMFESELRADDELNDLVAEFDRDFADSGDKLGDEVEERSALAIDQFRVAAWMSTIFYNVDSSISKENAAMVREAFKTIANKTACLKFVERPIVPEFQLGDTIMVMPMPAPNNSSRVKSCVVSSFARMSLNFVFLNFSCEEPKGELMHGLMHVLGVSHEYSRIDRDDYISIHWAKLKPKYIDFFGVDQPKYQTTYGTKFDFDSIMFYQGKIGSAKPEDDSMTPKVQTSSVKFGQRDHLSCGDVAILKRMYCCSSPVCTDRKPMCGIYATKRLCSTKENWFWLKNNCAKSCNLCCSQQCDEGCAEFCK